jgi:hypothetical protein
MNPGALKDASSTNSEQSKAPVEAKPVPTAVSVERDDQGPFVRLRERISDSFGATQTTDSIFRYGLRLVIFFCLHTHDFTVVRRVLDFQQI